MAQRLPSSLSPKAKQAILVGPSDAQGEVLIEVSPRADLDELRAHVEEVGGRVVSSGGGAGLVTARVPTSGLLELAADRDVIYIEMAAPLRPDATDGGPGPTA